MGLSPAALAKRKATIKRIQSTPEYKSRERIADRRRKRIKYRTPLGRLRSLAQTCTTRARREGREYDRDYLMGLASAPPESCASCGRIYDYSIASYSSRESGPSFDRIDNSKGYVRDNVAIICTRCNMIKKDATVEELRNILKYMEENLK